MKELFTLEHWKPTWSNLRSGAWWPNAFLNALPSFVFKEPVKFGWGDWDSYWA